jgi:hypothetical protein
MFSEHHKKQILTSFTASTDLLTIPVSELAVVPYILTSFRKEYPDIPVGYDSTINVSSESYLFISAFI